MPFAYTVTAGVEYATSGTPDTEDAWLAFRQVTKGFQLVGVILQGKGNGLTALSGIVHRLKRWTTAGSGGTAVVPSPTSRESPAAVTTPFDSQTALTPGTVSGALQMTIGHGATGPGGWQARDDNAKKTVEAGSADEITWYSESGTASLDFECSQDIEEL